MRCTHCHTYMFIAESVNDKQTEQMRYQCPVCGHQHLLTQLRIIKQQSMQQAAFVTDMTSKKFIPA